MKKKKIIWYEFFDEHNHRIYDVAFHEDGDLVAYRSYGKIKDEILHEILSGEDASCYCYEYMKMAGKFERVSEPDEKAPEVDSTSVSDNKDL